MKIASEIILEESFKPLVDYMYNLYKKDSEMILDLDESESKIPDDLMQCLKSRPKTILELTDGVTFDIYDFKGADEVKLGLLGFFNLGFKKEKKILIVEFCQTGTKYCVNKPLKYGIGARMILKVDKASFGAKLNSPQQISASVIFNKATVQYSIKTFGIVGPGVSNLVKAGILHEDSYGNFLKDISSLIVEIYKNKSQYKITPQPLFL